MKPYRPTFPKHPNLWRSVCMLAVGLTASVRAAHDPVESFNYLLGTQTIGAHYQFTDEPRLVETARVIHEMGSNILKFRIGKRFAKRNYSGPNPGEFENLRDLAENDPAIRTVLDMPFQHYFIWVDPMQEAGWRDEDGYTESDQAIEYQEIYDLAIYLMETYNGTGKQFYFGNWEGDWLLLREFNSNADPDEETTRNMIAWFNNRQRAVDDAKRDFTDTDVGVFHYIEVNLVEKAILGRPALVNTVLPHTPVDFVSYSAYEIGNDYNLEEAMTRTMDFIAKHLPDREGVPEKRVFIGEFGYKSTTYGPEIQRGRTVEFMDAALAWGSPFILYWQIYCNEFFNERYNGFWLIDDQGEKWPLYHIFADYFTEAKAYVAAHLREHGVVPTLEQFIPVARDILRLPEEALPEDSEAPVHVRDFACGTLDGWTVEGGTASVISDKPFAGEHHLHLETGDSAWTVASFAVPAAPGELWEGSVKALRNEGRNVNLKLEFMDDDGRLVLSYLRTGVNSDYMHMTLRERVPEGAVQAKLVLGVNQASPTQPGSGYFDQATLRRLALPPAE